ncbi:hypothetical protein [Streptomyces griseorubiginosus]|uniref:hypothetical protein n=1 Tax=Streptomyces griseorubiginosus TaxID=67304 RepID=UPI002E81B6C6|nr:hypothetical protein [Streptomyces griseorubiginosus]WUB42532.1 hypothetical protein OHN19_03965 [Streptomyces griseorubiginosus]WUB51050.1 hypothetical protein OG942_03960 [Streptomyces griseorubiginosus]
MPDCEVGQQVHPPPDAIPSKTAALVEPFTVAAHAVRRAAPRKGETAVVFGAGTIGTGAAIALEHLGCSTVMVVDLSDFRLAKAAELGFATCNSGTEDLREKAVQVFGEARALRGTTADVDIYVEAAGLDALVGTYPSSAPAATPPRTYGTSSTSRRAASPTFPRSSPTNSPTVISRRTSSWPTT